MSERSAATNRWMRWLHVYTSMISLIIVLFFGITGLTLNHPSWTLGDDTDRTTSAGQLPPGFVADGTVDFLTVSEFVRSEHGVSGEVTEHALTGNDGTISYRAPGYAADLFFEVDSGTYRLVVEQQGFVGVMNDLHKGRDAPGSWKWVIDISAGLLVLVSVTGLGIQLFQRKRRTRALVFVALGLVVTVLLTFVALY
ncbi:MAG: PepSY-associated TM helix domain-containing protein [Actinomycetota bacterium]|nr:PepSY-associated TM helix domain-containing protein [Actinomycetota bacterium]